MNPYDREALVTAQVELSNRYREHLSLLGHDVHSDFLGHIGRALTLLREQTGIWTA